MARCAFRWQRLFAWRYVHFIINVCLHGEMCISLATFVGMARCAFHYQRVFAWRDVHFIINVCLHGEMCISLATFVCMARCAFHWQRLFAWRDVHFIGNVCLHGVMCILLTFEQRIFKSDAPALLNFSFSSPRPEAERLHTAVTLLEGVARSTTGTAELIYSIGCPTVHREKTRL